MERRLFVALAMHMIGENAHGTWFREAVCTLDLCAQGARISNVREPLRVGQELTLEYKKHRVRFRVVWFGQAGTASQGQVGLQAIGSVNEIGDLKELFTGEYVDTWCPTPQVENARDLNTKRPTACR